MQDVSPPLSHRPPDGALWFLPLGGTGEFGINISLYGTAGKWLMVDCGVMIADDTTPGVEVILPDPTFIVERKADLVGLVLTHGHDDHIGAIEYLWPLLECPIYATPYTAALVRSKLSPHLQRQIKIQEIPPGGSFDLAPFACRYIPVTHSIPEAQMLVIETPQGRVLHTGDWRFDADPLIGSVSDEAALQALGDAGLLALVGNSTNATVSDASKPERSVLEGLIALFPQIKQRIILTCVSSQIARLHSVAAAARDCGRQVGLVGRSLWRNASVAASFGYLPEYESFLDEDEVRHLPQDRVVLVVTGSQAERRAALSRIATGSHPSVSLREGDTVLFSSRDNIPSRQAPLAALQNILCAKGVKVLTRRDVPIHVSGHPPQEDLRHLFSLTRPRLVLPVHGEARHQEAHAKLARDCGVGHTLVPKDGTILRLAPEPYEGIAEVPHGRWALDGKIMRPLNHAAAKDRRKMAESGAVVVTVVMDEKGRICDTPRLSLLGLVENGPNEESFSETLATIVQGAVDRMPKSARLDPVAVRHAVSLAVRRYVTETQGKKPVTDVHVVRV